MAAAFEATDETKSPSSLPESRGTYSQTVQVRTSSVTVQTKPRLSHIHTSTFIPDTRLNARRLDGIHSDQTADLADLAGTGSKTHGQPI